MRIEGKLRKKVQTGKNLFEMERLDGSGKLVNFPVTYEKRVGEIVATQMNDQGNRVWLDKVPCPECRTEMLSGDENLICPSCQHQEPFMERV